MDTGVASYIESIPSTVRKAIVSHYLAALGRRSRGNRTVRSPEIGARGWTMRRERYGASGRRDLTELRLAREAAAIEEQTTIEALRGVAERTP